MSSNFYIKFASQIQFRVVVKAILRSLLEYRSDYFRHCYREHSQILNRKTELKGNKHINKSNCKVLCYKV